METERVFLLLAACASAAWARGKGGAGTGGGGNSWRGGEFCSLVMLVVIIAGILVIGDVDEFVTCLTTFAQFGVMLTLSFSNCLCEKRGK